MKDHRSLSVLGARILLCVALVLPVLAGQPAPETVQAAGLPATSESPSGAWAASWRSHDS